MNTSSIKRKLQVCRRCEFLCTGCPHALPCAVQGQQVKPVECYLCWHNQGTVLPGDCSLRHTAMALSGKNAKGPARRRTNAF
jgi:hypothetical protein